MKQEVVSSSGKNTEETVAELVRHLSKPASQYQAVLFFASSDYDFAALSEKLKEQFTEAEVIGTSTSGEITQNGFVKHSVCLTALSCTKTKFSGVILDNVDKFPIVHRQDIEQAAEK